MSRPLSNFALCVVFSSSFFGVLLSQTAVSGTVLDETNQPLSFAGIMLLNPADSLLVKGDVSSDNGTFRFEGVPAGDYLIGISMIGYTDFFSAPFQLAKGTPNHQVGTLHMTTNSLQLAEVQVVARKPLFEQRIDRLVVNVAESVTAAGGTALEVLERSPGVIVNRQTENISISGKSGVIIMINNKISRLPLEAILKMLDAMPANNIERIEIITTPPANFDAEGSGGIISIIMKKSLDEGFNGSFNLSAGYGVHEKMGGGLNFNFRKDKINLFGDYSRDYNHTRQQFTNYRALLQNGVLLENDNVSDRFPVLQNQSARLGLDVQLTPKTVLGVLGTWGWRDWQMDAVNTVRQLENQQLVEEIIIDNEEVNNWESWLANINLQHELPGNGRLTFDLDYASYKNNNPTTYVNNFFNPAGQLLSSNQLHAGKETPIDIYVAKADFTKDLTPEIGLEIGVKATYSQFDNNFLVENRVQDTWVTDPTYSANYGLEEQIGAAYSALSWKITPTTGVKAGLRYEYTDTNLGTATDPNIIDRQYGNWFPSVFLTRDFMNERQLQASYSRRINRPAYTQLAPFVIFLDPNTLLSGNIALQPDYTDAFRLGYRFKAWFTSLEYSYTDQAISRFQPRIDPVTNRQINAPLNLDFQRSVSGNVSFPWQVTSWWSMRNNLTGFWRENYLVFDEVAITNSGFTFQANSTQSFLLPWDLKLEVSGFYRSPLVNGLLKTKAFGDANIGLQRSFGEQGGTLRLNLASVFKTDFYTNGNLPEINLNYRGKYGFAERVIRISYSRDFGNSGVKNARRRTTGSEEERGRVDN